MAFGLKVWGSNGQVELDVSTNLQMYVATYPYVFPNTYTNSMVVPTPLLTSVSGYACFSTNVFHYTVISAGSVQVHRNTNLDYHFGQAPQSGKLIIYKV